MAALAVEEVLLGVATMREVVHLDKEMMVKRVVNVDIGLVTEVVAVEKGHSQPIKVLNNIMIFMVVKFGILAQFFVMVVMDQVLVMQTTMEHQELVEEVEVCKL